MNVQGRVALVAGGFRGIGRAIAWKLVALGARAVNDRVNDAATQEVVEVRVSWTCKRE